MWYLSYFGDFQSMEKEKKHIQDIQNTFYVSQKKIIEVWKDMIGE